MQFRMYFYSHKQTFISSDFLRIKKSTTWVSMYKIREKHSHMLKQTLTKIELFE